VRRLQHLFIYSLCLLDVQLFSSQIDKNEMILIWLKNVFFTN
jgi:hypothetical protein